MHINNDILYDFIHCPYKAYRKSKYHTGIISDHQTLYNRLKQIQKINFEKGLNQTLPITTFNDPIPKQGIALNMNFKNANLNLTLDGIEFTGKKNIIPIFITPYEKVTKTDKLFLALQGTLIQNEFAIQVETCKIIYGKILLETTFKLSSFAKKYQEIYRCIK